MYSDFAMFIIYVIVFWIILYIIYKKLRLDRFNIEFKSYVLVMWRTKKLNNVIYTIATSFRKFWKILFTIGIFLAIGKICFTLNFLINNVVSYLTRKVVMQPVVPLIPGFTISTSSIHYFLLSVIAVFIIHEFAHGIAAIVEKLNIKSIGVFLALFIGGGFVELDENELSSANLISKLRVLASGSTANLITGILAILIITNFTLAISPFYGSSSGVIVVEVIENSPAKIYGIKPGDIIFKINGIEIINSSEFSNVLSGIRPNSLVILTTARGDIEVIGGSHPNNPLRVFLGIRVFNYHPPKFLPYIFTPDLPYHYYNFLNWFQVISISAALINMLPIQFFDGGRFFDVLLNNSRLSLITISIRGQKVNFSRVILETLKFLSLTLLILNISQSMLLGNMLLR